MVNAAHVVESRSLPDAVVHGSADAERLIVVVERFLPFARVFLGLGDIGNCIGFFGASARCLPERKRLFVFLYRLS